ncbi:MAG: hypothetical protein C0P77_006660 [Thermoanaerobacterales bacterium]|jgi:hypothetical protein|nr:hypothetical protein [Thermoanaerobacterales bacterium]
MSTLWTPSGEHPVGRPDQGAPSSSSPPPGSGAAAGASPDDRPRDEELARQLEAARRQLLQMPAGVVVGQQALQFYEVAALHLSEPEPKLEEARVAIDALVAVVEKLGDRLGEAQAPLRQALNRIQLAFVERSSEVRAKAAGSASGSPSAASTTSASGSAGSETAGSAAGGDG